MDPLIARYKQLPDLKNAEFRLIEHVNAMVASVYSVTLASGKECVLKICSRPGDYFREVYFLKYFRNKIPIPKISELIQPQMDIAGAILMEKMAGNVLNTEDINEGLAYLIGSILAKIHLNSALGYGDLTAPQNLSSNPGVPFTEKFQEGLEECKDHLPAHLIDQCKQHHDRHIHLLDYIDGPCIVHRDFRPGNIIVCNNEIQGVIDWSSARASFAEEDLCRIALGEWPQHQAFLAGYASVRPIPNYQKLMPLLSLSKAIGVIGFTVKRKTWNGKDHKIYNRHKKLLEDLLKF